MGSYVNFNILDEDYTINTEELEIIANNNLDSTEFNIYEVIEKDIDSKQMAFPIVVVPRLSNIRKSYSHKNYKSKTDFIISVAKGQKTTLTRSKTSSISPSITGGASISDLGLKGKISKTYTVSHQFSGPPESSKYNSRNFYLDHIINKGTYTAIRKYPGGPRMKVSGRFSEPVRLYSYSKDYLR